MNVVIVRGRLSRPPEHRDLPSGDTVVSYEVTVERPGERSESVPVVWHAPPPRALDLEPDTEVVAVGRVRRRFFRARGAIQSRTEVVADAVVPARQATRVRQLLAAAAEAVADAAGGGDHGCRPG
jgi:single-strand DNA-binding protein